LVLVALFLSRYLWSASPSRRHSKW
jgi:hypothetical protein